jgi:decaprenylphospho-beta-D-erythro-pentofuranosid-2-ulose 2-reductase
MKGIIRSAYILGSTSPISVELCRKLAQQGCQRFWLVARDAEENQRLARDLSTRFSLTVNCSQADLLTHRIPSDSTLALQQNSFDLYVIAIGYMGDQSLAQNDPAEALRIADANYSGLLPWINEIITPDRIEHTGRLWLMSSVAGDRGRPSNYNYGAAKAALTTLGEGLALRCRNKPFRVRVLKAGYMDTAMTFGQAPPALCASPEAIACQLLNHPDRNGVEYLPPFWGTIMQIIRALPPALVARL